MTAQIVNDVTGLNPVPVWAVTAPTTVEEVRDAIMRTTGPISVGGGHFSMGGQTASPGSLHLDMRRLNRVISLSPVERTIRVQAGIRWCDIQKFVDPHGLSVKIMQSYANFTAGGSLSVNVHGRYVGLGPLILSVRSITLVLMNGEIRRASPNENPELFYGAIGGYGGLGVIVEAELDLAENRRVERVVERMPVGAYARHFRATVRNSDAAVFHNGDIYVPHYSRVCAVTWNETLNPATVPHRLQPHRRMYVLERYFLWAVSETPFGKWRREFLIDPLLHLGSKVHWRNYEAGYDVAELEPPSRRRRTYVLQEYFVPVERFDEFVPKMAEIFQRHRVNVLNVSIRHALPDTGSLLAWARSECFAFVVYYKQRTRENAKDRVAVWTRELIDAVIATGGTYYLPYQAHATPEQFHRAYPRAREYFELKSRLDPEFRLRNVLWDKYYAPALVAPQATASATEASMAHPIPSDSAAVVPMAGPVPSESAAAVASGNLKPSEPVGLPPTVRVSPAGVASAPRAHSDFHCVYDDIGSQDAFYRFLQNVYRICPEDRFHTLIKESCGAYADDEGIYRAIQRKLPSIKPLLADAFYALPALVKQKKEMGRQTRELAGERRAFDGYVEIGSTGRYVGALQKELALGGDLVLINDFAPGHSPVDIVERGRLAKVGRYVPLDNYVPIAESAIASESVDLVSCYIGLHHIEPSRVDPFIASFARILRPGGVFILRDHDVKTPAMFSFVALAHVVFNAGLGFSWETNCRELRHFAPVADWSSRLAAAGLRDSGKRLLQAHDPSDNVLMAFTKS